MPAHYKKNNNAGNEIEKKLEMALDRAAIIYQAEVKQQLSGPKTDKNLGVKTGALRRSIQKETPKKLTRRVGTNLKYGALHEFGGVISTKVAKFLRFKIGDKWISTKSVIIPARPFMRPAFKKVSKKMKQQFKGIL